MLTKKNLWFLTLFSIILVMAVYYISVPGETLSKPVNGTINNQDGISVTVKESEAITALRINREEELEKEVASIKEILTNVETTSEEKNDAYEALKSINNNKSKEELLEGLIKKNYNYENFVKIDNVKVKVVIDSTDHSYELANKIINTVQGEFDKKMYITVNFQSK